MNRWALLFASLLVVATACKDGEPADDQDLRTADPEVLEAALRVGAAWAEKESTCEETDPQMTQAFWKAYYENEARSVGPGLYLFAQEAVAPCVAAIEAMPCNEFDEGLPAACDGLFHGEAAIGEACDPGCVRGATCRATFGSSCSLCVAQLAEGAACGGSEPQPQECGNNLYCIDGHCGLRPVAAVGESCFNADCVHGSYCSSSGCLPRKTSGDCTYLGECAPGYTCFESSCVAWPRVGEACLGDRECSPYLACVSGRCQAQEADSSYFSSWEGRGASCDSQKKACLPALECAEGSKTCEAKPACQ